jgi:hypothetical protein
MGCGVWCLGGPLKLNSGGGGTGSTVVVVAPAADRPNMWCSGDYLAIVCNLLYGNRDLSHSKKVINQGSIMPWELPSRSGLLQSSSK